MKKRAAGTVALASSLRAHFAAIADLPGPRGTLLAGNRRQVPLEHLPRILEAWTRTYGSMYRIRFGPFPIVVLSDRALIRDLLKRRPDEVRRLRTIQSVFDELGVGGVFAAEGEAWRRQRRLVMPAFKKSRLALSLPMVHTVAGRLRDIWLSSAGQVRDLRRDFSQFAADVTTLVAFGVDLNTLEGGSGLREHIDAMFETMGRRLSAPVPYWRYVKLPSDRRCDRALVELRAAVRRIMRDARGSSRQTLLAAMHEARLEGDHNKRGLSEDEVVANVLTVLVAGQHTTASALAWMSDAIARHPDIQQRLRTEVTSVLGERDVPTSLEQAEELAYLGAVFRETLRLRSPAPLLYLEPVRPIELGGRTFPAGLPLAALTRAMAIDEHNFEDAGEFRPERWLDMAKEPDAYAPFGGGPRLCPGLHLSALEAQVVVSTLIANFEIEPARATPPAEVTSFTSMPDAVPVRLRPLGTRTSR